jgi:hypothetical protein
MADIIVKFVGEMVPILSIAIKETKQNLFGKHRSEDTLMKLDILTQEEVHMTIIETIRIMQNVADNVKIVLEGA